MSAHIQWFLWRLAYWYCLYVPVNRLWWVLLPYAGGYANQTFEDFLRSRATTETGRAER